MLTLLIVLLPAQLNFLPLVLKYLILLGHVCFESRFQFSVGILQWRDQ